MGRHPVIVHLELEPTAEPVAGRVSVDGTSHEFVGWLALMDVLAAHVADARAAGSHEQA